MNYYDVEEFCRNLCYQEENKKEFQEFSKDYTYFKPYFDYVMIKKHYIFMNPLFQANNYLKTIGNSFYMVNLETSNPTYQEIFDKIVRCKNGGNYSFLVACSDTELHIKSADIHDEVNTMLDPNGYSLTTTRDEKQGNHEITSNTIVNQLLIGNKYLSESYDNQYAVMYLVEKFGFIRALCLKDGGLLIGIKDFLTPQQKEYCDLIVEKGGCFHNIEINSIYREKEEYKIRR